MATYRSRFPEHTNYARIIRNGPYTGFMFYGFCLSITKMTCYPSRYGIGRFYTLDSPIDDYLSFMVYFGKRACEIKLADYGKRPSKVAWDLQIWWWTYSYKWKKYFK